MRIASALVPVTFAAAFLLAGTAHADDPAFGRVSRKIEFLSSGHVPPGSVISFSPEEVDAWVRTSIPARYKGIRAPKLTLGAGSATGFATIDFAKLLEGEGQALNPFVARLFGDEHPVQVAARIESSGGHCVITPTRVEISGVAATGATLDLLVKTILLPLFPDAKIGEPFELGLNIDRLDVRPDGLRVVIKKK